MSDLLAVLPYLAADSCVRLLPRPFVRGLARAIARVAFELRVPARQTLERNLARLGDGTVPGPAGGVVAPAARAAFERFALAFVDFLGMRRSSEAALRESIVVEGEEHLRHAAAAGRGVIVLSVHAGNWELGAAWLAARGVPLRIVARPHAHASVESFFARRRAEWGVSALRGAPLWLAASRALRRREWVAMMGDRPPAGARGSLCGWAAAIARRTGALVLPATMTRLADGRYLASFDAPLDPASCAEGGYRDAMMRHVRRAPGQWFAFEPFGDAITGPA